MDEPLDVRVRLTEGHSEACTCARCRPDLAEAREMLLKWLGGPGFIEVEEPDGQG